MAREAHVENGPCAWTDRLRMGLRGIVNLIRRDLKGSCGLVQCDFESYFEPGDLYRGYEHGGAIRNRFKALLQKSETQPWL